MQRLEIYAVIPDLILFAQQLHNLTALTALGMYYCPGSSAATSALASALATCSGIQELALDADVPVSRQKRGLEVSAHQRLAYRINCSTWTLKIRPRNYYFIYL